MKCWVSRVVVVGSRTALCFHREASGKALRCARQLPLREATVRWPKLEISTIRDQPTIVVIIKGLSIFYHVTDRDCNCMRGISYLGHVASSQRLNYAYLKYIRSCI